jgi:hypothetical protein
MKRKKKRNKADYLPIDRIFVGDGKNCWDRQFDKLEYVEAIKRI